MSGNVIKEFLVALGFKVDAAGLKRFNEGIASATKVAAKAGTVVTAMAVAVEVAVVKVSKQFEDLYYASQRINSSVENIRGMDYAVSQLGGTAQGARAAMEGLASFMRSNPGGERFIRTLGVETRDANGELRDTALILRDLATQFKGMPYYAAKVRANLLGIDEQTLQALIRGTGEFSDQYSAMARKMGIDQQAAAKASHDFMVQVRELKVQLELLIGKVLIDLQGPGGRALRNFAETGVVVLMSIGNAMVWVIDKLNLLDDATSGWSSTLIALLALLAPLLALLGPIVVGVGLLIAGIVTLTNDFNTWRAGGKSLIDWSTWAGEIDRVMTALQPFIRVLKSLVGWLADVGGAILEWLGPRVANVAHAALESLAGGLDSIANAIRIIVALLRGDWKGAWEASKTWFNDWAASWGAVWDKLNGGRDKASPSGRGAAASPSPSAAPAASSASGAGVGGRAVDIGRNIQRYLQSQGLTGSQAQGVAAGMWAESKFDANAVNPTSGAFGIGQWLGPRKKALFKKYGPRPTLQQQLEFMAWELKGGDHGGAAVLKQQNASGALDAYIRKFMRPAAGDETTGDLARGAQYLSSVINRPVLATGAAGGSPVTITQKTDIHVTGGGDPAATGRAVAGQQSRVNGDLVRNTRGAVR